MKGSFNYSPATIICQDELYNSNITERWFYFLTSEIHNTTHIVHAILPYISSGWFSHIKAIEERLHTILNREGTPERVFIDSQ